MFAFLVPLFQNKAAYLQPSQIQPLNSQQFTRRVLVPEAAVLLVMEDCKCSREDAVETVIESRLYGMAVNGLEDQG
jgi:hypothetical protein